MIRSVGLEGMRGYEVLVEADVRNEKEQCVICWAARCIDQGVQSEF